MKGKRVIIIGSGLGGLVAGNLLARKKHQVTIFESHSSPGGYTAGFYRKGFYFESGTSSFGASASVFKAMKDIGVFKDIEFTKQKISIRSEDLNGTLESYTDLKKMFYNAYPANKAQLDSFFTEMNRIIRVMGVIFDIPIPYLYKGLSLIPAIVPYILKGSELIKVVKEYYNITVPEFLERFFPKDSNLYWFFNRIGYPDMVALNLAVSMNGMLTDYWTVKTGMQSWADTLAGSFQKYGGQLKLNAYVDKIITKNNAAVGVSCQNINYDADYIISASDYKKTFLTLLDNPELISEDLREKVSKAAVSQSFFTVYLGLKIPNEDLRKFLSTPYVAYIQDKPNYDIHNPNDETFFNKTSITVYSPSLINPKHAPEGKSSLMLQTFVPNYWMDNWGNGDKARYRQLKEQAVKAMIMNSAKLIPGLETFIEYQDAATPLTYERFTHNTDGASSSWNWDPKKKFHDKQGLLINTPVKNLYIGSCWAMQNGGVPGALAAAYQCVNKIK